MSGWAANGELDPPCQTLVIPVCGSQVRQTDGPLGEGAQLSAVLPGV